MSAVFTERDVAQVRKYFGIIATFYSIETAAIYKTEPQGRFMNVFIAQKNDPAKERAVPYLPFVGCWILSVALNEALSSREWSLVQASVMREGDFFRVRVRIEKNEIKQNNER